MRTEKPMAQASYSPEIFAVGDFEAGKIAVVGSTSREPLEQTNERWEKETPWLAEEIIRGCGIEEGDDVLDYGCGIGRVAKEIIKRTGCRVTGVDQSPEMRALAVDYVQSEGFAAISSLDFRTQVLGSRKFKSAYCTWVLQHCVSPTQIVDTIKMCLPYGAPFYVLNEKSRYIPTTAGWVDDGLSIEELLKSRFAIVRDGEIPVGVTGKTLSERSRWYLFRKTA